MNQNQRTVLELLLKQVVGVDDEKIKEALDPIFDGEWELLSKLNEGERNLVQNLLHQLSTIDENVIQSLLSMKNPIQSSSDDTQDGTSLDTQKLIRAAVLLCSYIFYDDFHYPQPQVGPYNIADNNFEKLKWVYRYWFNQLEVAEAGSQLEQYFSNQNLDFTLEDFQVESKVSLSSGGDLLAVDVLVPENTKHLFDDIQDFYSSADIVCANLESTVDSRKPIGRTQTPGQPAQMNTSEAMFQKFLEEGGINYFSTANNHSFDWGEDGVFATLDVLEKSGAFYSGTNLSKQQQEDILIIEKNGIKIAMLSYTFDLNGHTLPNDKTYLVNEVRFNDENCDLSLVQRHVAKAKEKDADIIIACCHWGWEFEMYPHTNVCEVARKMNDYGIDVILGNHPHVSQPMESISHSNEKEAPKGLIVYSYGDFVSYHPESQNSKIAYVTKFDIVKGKSRSNGETQTRITNLRMLPIYILNNELPDGSYDCRILKFSEVRKNPEKYGLTALERSQLPHLNDVVLHQILLPKEHQGLLVE